MQFLGIEAAGGILLMAATVVALVWANSPWSGGYHDLWHTEVHLGIGDLHLEHDGHPLTLVQLVNDALMAVFFFVVGVAILFGARSADSAGSADETAESRG